MNHFQEVITYVGYTKASLAHYISEKTMYSTLIWIFTFLFGVEMNYALTALLALMFFDMITGMAYSVQSGKPIQSRMVLRSAIKLSIYSVLISSTHLVESVVPGSTMMDEGMVIFLAITELISIIENVGKMGYAVPKRILNQLLAWKDGDLEIDDRRTGPDTRRDDEIVLHTELPIIKEEESKLI